MPHRGVFRYEAVFERGTQYMVQPPSGFLLPGQQLALTVTSAPIPTSSPTTDNLYGDTLTITTDREGDTPHVVDVRQTARGAILAWDKASVAFPGTSTATDRVTAALVLRNAGNIPALDVTVTGTGGFAFDHAHTDSLAPGDLAGNAVYRASLEGDEAGTIAVAGTTSALCGPLPTVTATAKGTFAGATPIEVDLISGASVGTSTATLFARFPDGRIASIGADEFGMRGANTSLPPVTPTIVRDIDDTAVAGLVDVVGARASVCGLRDGGDVLCWGNVGMARPRDILTIAPQPAATRVAAGASAVALTYGARCITANGHTTCLANAPNHINATSWTPTEAAQLSLHAGGGYALHADGTVVSFGSNAVGERGDPAAPGSVASIPGLTGVKKVIAMSERPNVPDSRGGCALKQDGTVWCWGSGDDGRNGDGTNNDRYAPVQVMIDPTTPLAGVRDLAGTNQFRCAVTPDDLYCWGDVPSFSDVDQATPIASAPITDGISISTSWTGGCLLRSAGLITCFGDTPFSAGPLTDYTGFVAPTP